MQKYTNSPLVNYVNLTKNKTTNRNHDIDTITIHCIVGQWTAKKGCDYFATTNRQCSANYVVGYDGSIGLSVEEKDRSWCSSSASNDNRAVTIEVASDTTHPYAVTDKAYDALIELVADICKRNGIKKLLWKGDKSLIGQVDKQNMTVHRWFANKACPGEYLYSRHSDIANKVNMILGKTDLGNGYFEAEDDEVIYKIQIGNYYTKSAAMYLIDKLKADGYDAVLVDGEVIEKKEEPKKEEALKLGDKVKIKPDAYVYGTNRKFSSWVYNATLYVRGISGDKITISTLKTGAVTGNVKRSDIIKQ